MKKLKMISGSLIPVIGLGAQANPLQTEKRASPPLTLRIQKLNPLASPSDSEILQGLKARGVYPNERSEILVYEENDYLDLQCFDCAVFEYELNSHIPQPQNDEIITRTAPDSEID